MDISDITLFVRVVRHLLGDGWNTYWQRDPGKTRQVEWSADRGVLIVHSLDTTGADTHLLRAEVTSMQQAADYLVVAGILPAAFSSFAPPPVADALCGGSSARRVPV